MNQNSYKLTVADFKISTKIVLVNWKRSSDTCACINSLLLLDISDWYGVICENGSPDESAIELRDFLKNMFVEKSRECNEVWEVYDYYSLGRIEGVNPKITLVLSRRNLGFAGGNNIAVAHSFPDISANYVWFLNNDTEVEPNTLSEMVTYMQVDPQIGICGSTLIYAHDRETVQAYGGARYSRWTGAVQEIGQGNSRFFPVDRSSVEMQIDYISGASMLVSRDFLANVGPLSEDYFLYYEEIDWAVRARKAGYRLGYAPDAIVYHKEGAVLGSGKSSDRSILAEYYGVRNRFVFTRKFFPWALPTVFIFSAMQIVRRCLQGRWVHARLMAAVLLGLRRTAPQAKVR